MASDHTVRQLPMNEGLCTWSHCSSAPAVYSGKRKPPRSIWVSVSTRRLFWDPVLSSMEMYNVSVHVYFKATDESKK